MEITRRGIWGFLALSEGPLKGLPGFVYSFQGSHE